MNIKTENILLQIPSQKEGGFEFIWENNSVIETRYSDNALTIKTNKDGLISLGRHLIALAQDTLGEKYHISFDEFNDLEEGSKELIIEKDNSIRMRLRKQRKARKMSDPFLKNYFKLLDPLFKNLVEWYNDIASESSTSGLSFEGSATCYESVN